MFDLLFNPYIKFPISDEVIEIIIKNGEKKSYKVGEVIVNPYEYIEFFYYIDSGLIEYISTDLDGKEQVIGITGSGSSLGVTPILSDTSSKEIIAIAIKPSEVYRIHRNTFLKLIDSSKIFRDYIIKGLANGNFTMINIISNLTMCSCKKRLYELLLFSIKKESKDNNDWYRLDYPYTQEQLSKIIGVSRRTLQNTLYSLRDEGLVKLFSNKIEVKVEKDKYDNIISHDL